MFVHRTILQLQLQRIVTTNLLPKQVIFSSSLQLPSASWSGGGEGDVMDLRPIQFMTSMYHLHKLKPRN